MKLLTIVLTALIGWLAVRVAPAQTRLPAQQAPLILKVESRKCDQLTVRGTLAPQPAKKEIEILVQGPIQRGALFTLSVYDNRFEVRFPDLERGPYQITVALALNGHQVATQSASTFVTRCR